MSQPRKHLPTAYTLVELVLAIAILAMLIGGLTSAMVVATKAVPAGDVDPTRTLACHAAADQIAGELTNAVSIVSRGANLIEFTVPDRNADSSPEAIRYSWSGVAGEALKRTYNAGFPTSVVSDVREFALTYGVASTEQDVPGADVEGGQTLLAENTSVANVQDQSVTAAAWPGQFIRPALPAGATGWRLTKVNIRAKSNTGTAGSTRVQIRTAADGDRPCATILAEQVLLEADLKPTYAWVTFSFLGLPSVPANTGLCLVLQHQADTDACSVSSNKSTYIAYGKQLNTADAGASWSVSHTSMLTIQVYGDVITPGTATTTTTYALDEVRIGLRAGDDASARVETAVMLLNEPAVSGP